MNDTILNIEGIQVIRKIIHGEHTTDVIDCILLKDIHGSEIQIDVNNGKIINSTWRRS
jgi:hypothetical protein